MIQIKKPSAMILVICLLSLIVNIQPILSQENAPIGKVTAIRGKVIAISEKSNSRALFLKAPVFLKDTIKTKNGRVQMMFKDNTLITLGRNSDIEVTEYLWEPGNTRSKMKTRVEEGSFRILGGAITRIAPNNFKTDSPSGTIGIRGSMYAGRVENAALFVVFQGGKGIYVQNSAGMVDITRPGFGTQVKNIDQAPEKPQKVTPAELQKLESALATAPLPQEESEISSSVDPGTEDPDTTKSNITATETTEPENTETATQKNNNPDKILPLEETPPLAENPLPPSPPTIPQLDPPIHDPQDALTPTGTQQKLQFMLLSLGVTDISLTTSVSASGISSYKGKMLQNLPDFDPSKPGQTMKFVVNWDNNRIIGFEENSSGSSPPGFGFGTIDKTTGEISNMRVLGSGGDPGGGAIMAMTGSETFGHFYGTNAGGLGLAMEGYDYNVQNQTQYVPWSDFLAAKLETTSANPYSGTATWNGFFVGVSENMANPNTGRRVFTNTSASDFSLSINKSVGVNAGTFSGSLVGEDFNNPANDITALTIGGTNDSAYLTDKILAAAITSGSIDIGGSTGGVLKDYGNYMVTANEPMLSEYTTWGYWEIAYVDPATSQDYHLHVPGSMWVAGEQTSATNISSYISASFTGTYEGKARGVRLNPANQMTGLTNGTTNLTLNFTPGAPTKVSGNISFDEITLFVNNTTTDISNTGFTATITNAVAGQSAVNGAFYGPGIAGGSGTGPAAVGGNFSAQMSDGNQYHGIFAGDLQ